MGNREIGEWGIVFMNVFTTKNENGEAIFSYGIGLVVVIEELRSRMVVLVG